MFRARLGLRTTCSVLAVGEIALTGWETSPADLVGPRR